MTTATRIQPGPAYESSHLVTIDLLRRIHELAHDMPTPDDPSINWGHVGSMNEINRQLSQVIETLEGVTC